MRAVFGFLALSVTLLLAGCDDDSYRDQVNGLPVYCNPLGDAAAVIYTGCVECTVDDVSAASDRDFRTAATVSVLSSPDRGGAAIRASTLFFLGGSAGSRPGAFIRLPQDADGIVRWTTVRIRTYHSWSLTSERTAQLGSALGLIEGELAREDLPVTGDPAVPEAYVYFDADSAFDVMEIEFAAPGVRTSPARIQVHALCEDGGVL